MKKRIVIFADGTWNRPEKELDKDIPTIVLRLARAIKPRGCTSSNLSDRWLPDLRDTSAHQV